MHPLFAPVTVRDLEIPNRVWLPPMCQYQVDSRDGIVNDWHLMHYGSMAAGGFGLVIAEATAICPEGRISDRDAGLWNHEHILAWRRVTEFVQSLGARIGVQLAHAGRKAGTHPWLPGFPEGSLALDDGGWRTVAPSAVAMPGLAEPRELSHEEILALPVQFAEAARRAVAAGFDAVEIHAAHGYLLHEFLSPLSNLRIDGYGGQFGDRVRIVLEVVDAVREALPDGMPLIVRVSATDWVDDRASWDLAQTVSLSQLLRDRGVDVISVSSGGLVPTEIPVAPNYQTDLAAAIRKETGMFTAGVGLITDAKQAAGYLERGELDAVLIGRAALRDPHWPQRAAHELGLTREEIDYSPSYYRGAWR
ncbi:NADH:flavin oxidoreductase/NADH oxidase [Corynebacterium epidermidicanis]|uniref:NADH:flavin oxidoreductase n=1 Tax=Corynebacterium epidermidicanis TaxID=1050174 RepID=A0A0G3GUZ2_9CORY|nr:NADH:flavin oxidoreductase/NADH oxidase [Corynebacterium epidermidicanis]AKK04340.1 NADH:flavin oxidoreductase [Corynebacterium epidermidicanis]